MFNYSPNYHKSDDINDRLPLIFYSNITLVLLHILMQNFHGKLFSFIIFCFSHLFI